MLIQWLNSASQDYGRWIVYGLAATVAVLLLHLAATLVGSRGAAKERRPKWRTWDKAIYLLLAVAVGVLAATSFYATLMHGHMGGWLLFAHTAASGLFLLMLLWVALSWSAACGRRRSASEAPARFGAMTKLTYWLLLVAATATGGTMILSMMPLFGTDAMQQLLDVHRYSGLMVVLLGLVHGYLVLLGRLGLG